jgi:hypothetical protein
VKDPALTLFALTGVISSIACSSPEIMRKRGEGSGADLGNRGRVVRMHEGARPYEKTPKVIPTQNPPLDPARQADQLSRG